MGYEVWKTKDGREIKVTEMTDLHILHTIRAIIEGRIFAGVKVPVLPGRFVPDECSTFEIDVRIYDDLTGTQRENWLTVLKAEALKRDLDWSKPPTRKVGLIELMQERLARRKLDLTAAYIRDLMEELKKEGVPEPQVDVCNTTGKVTYLHWKVGPDLGTPVTG